ncbi:unnamed protein product, partial [Prorocentrum cordatum]
PGQCGEHRVNTSLACLRCEAGKAPNGDGECTECEETSVLVPLGAAVAVFMGLIAIYHFTATENRASQNNLRVLVVSIFGQLLAVAQILAVLSQLDVEWPSPFKFVLAFAKAFAFELEILRFRCIIDPSPVWDYSLKIVMFFVLLVAMFIIHTVHSLFFYKGGGPRRSTVFVGSMGTIVMAFFIVISSTIFSPFRCLVHPNGVSTVQSVPEIICFDSEDHSDMAIVGILAALIPVGFLSTVAYAVLRLPSRMASGDAEFLQMFAFLFFRFRPQTYWYVFLLLSRNLSVALIPVVPNVTGQLFLMFVLMGSSSILSAVVVPWRILLASMLDIFIGVSLLQITYPERILRVPLAPVLT